MIITVTLNTGIDRTLIVPEFKWNETIRVETVAVGMGGKAIDASWVLGELEIPSLALGFAAGVTGKQMEDMLLARGVKTDFTWVDGESRINTVVISSSGEGQTTLTGNHLSVSPEHISLLSGRYDRALEKASCVVIGGSLPCGLPTQIYTDMVRKARSKGIPVIFDASGPGLKAGLEGRPSLVKPNRAELQELLERELTGLEDIWRAADQLQKRYGCGVIVTLGAEGALALNGEKSYFIEPVKICDLKSAAGAGDAVLAGMAKAFSNGESFLEGLRWGFASASAVLKTLPTADCRREDVLELLPQIHIREFKLPNDGSRK